MADIHTLILLLLVVAGCGVIAHRFQFPEPILLVVTGMLLSFLPGIHHVVLEPEFIFLVFLPPLLYVNAFNTSWRDLKDNTRIMFLMAVGLVLVSTVAVGWVASELIGTLTLAAAFALGAIVSPPDAVAASAITEKLSVPRRVVTILDGESLLNDATALVLLSFAVTAVTSGTFSMEDALLRFVIVSIGGVAVGLGMGWLLSWVRHRVNDAPIEITLSLLSPYAAYLPAEWLHVSGVLACVTTGLYVGWKGPRMMSSYTRLESQAVWRMVTFLLNGLIFLITGLQLPVVLQGLQDYTPLALTGYALGIIATAILVRLVYVFITAYLPTYLFKSIRDRDPYPPWQSVFIVAWSGMRGVVSLAAAMALPTVTLAGAPFPGRELIIFLTFSMILGTLVFQGLTLPLIIKALNVGNNDCIQCDELEARLRATKAALNKLDAIAQHEETLPTQAEALDALRGHYQQRLEHYNAFPTEDGESVLNQYKELPRLHLNLLSVEREILIDLRNQGELKEEVMQTIQRDLDLQELQLRQQLMVGTAIL